MSGGGQTDCENNQANGVPCASVNTDEPEPGDSSYDNFLSLFLHDPDRRIKFPSDIEKPTWHFLEVDLIGRMTSFGNCMEPRVGHAVISLLPERKEIYVIGGGNNFGELDEVWKVDCLEAEAEVDVRWTCEIVDNLSENFDCRYEFLCALNKSKDKIWIFGGADVNNIKNDVVYIDITNNSLVSKTLNTDLTEPSPDINIPSPRTQGSNSCIVELNGEEYLVVFGGGVRKSESVPDAHIYLFNVKTSVWKRIEVTGSLPTPVQGHAMVAIGTKIYIHGGMTDLRLFDDFYMIDLGKEGEPKWNKIRVMGPPPHTKPEPRAAHGITVIGKYVYIFGGVGELGTLSDLWRYNTESHEWTLVDDGMVKFMGHSMHAVPPRLDFGMTNFPVDLIKPGGTTREPCHVILIHGGMNIMGKIFDDFWVYPIYDL